MNYGDDHNPYAPPTQIEQLRPASNGGDEDLQFPAEPWDRLLARLVDGFLILLLIVPWMIFLIAMDMISVAEFRDNSFASLKVLPAELPIAIYQWILISRTGQTIGKKWMRIRVVKLDGSPVGFGDGVALREWVIRGIGFIPCLGPIVSLVGILMIFGQERRCLHDHIAGTRVVKTLAG